MNGRTPPDYLRPYEKAAKQHGGGFPSLLWASKETQEARFDALSRLVGFSGSTMLDVGCGRADLLDFLSARNQAPKEYIGIEAVPELADAAERAAGRTPARVIRGDFIADPRLLFTGSDIVALSGALNTAKDIAFYDTLRRCFDATARHFVFNFLSSSHLAGAAHLHWREPADVAAYCAKLSPHVTTLDDYLQGDTTFLLSKPA